MIPGKLDVLYEDNHLIAVRKPAGIPVQKGRRGSSLDMVVKEYLKAKYKKPGNVFLGIVHRLDQPVSGIMIFAKTSKGASRLSEQFRGKGVEKIYRAVVIGKIREKKGVLRSRLTKERGGEFKAKEGSDGKEAVLEYRVVKEGMKNSLVEIKLGTGRFHQIRAQFAGTGHPVLGDIKYGSPIRLPDGKIALHSSRIAFKMATGERTIELSAGEPEEWKELL